MLEVIEMKDRVLELISRRDEKCKEVGEGRGQRDEAASGRESCREWGGHIRYRSSCSLVQ